MQKTIEQQIDRAKELLSAVKHAAMATVNVDGTPHNTPFMFMHDADLKHVYWGSHPESEHSKNVLRTGEIYVVVYDAVERGGLFLRAVNGHSLEDEELETALWIHNQVRKSRGQDELTESFYTGDSPQRMWSAEITGYWVNGSVRGEDGHIIRDVRTEVHAKDLI